MTASARTLGGIAAFVIATACGGTRAALSDSAGGDVPADSAEEGIVFHGVKYPLTSDNYRRWLVAQAALDSLSEPAEMPRVDLRDPTDDDIEATTDYLEHQDAARRAIERSGLTIRDFVLTSVALGQALSIAGRAAVPVENRAFVDANEGEIERVRERQRFHVVDEHDEGGGHGKGYRHKHKHGHGKSRGHGRH